MYRANRLMVNRLNRGFEKTGNKITAEQFRVLMHLWESNGLLQSELIAQTRKDKASLTRTLDIMERQNLIVRAPKETDQRKRRVFLTNKGKELKDILAPIAVKGNLDYVSMIGKENVEEARRILRLLIEQLDK